MTQPGEPVTHAVIDALAGPDGAIDNGPTLPRPSVPGESRRNRNGPVRTARAPIGAWTCDSCTTAGTGWPPLLLHSRVSWHQRYTLEQEEK